MCKLKKSGAFTEKHDFVNIVEKLSTGTCTGVNHFYYTIDRKILHYQFIAFLISNIFLYQKRFHKI